jgi:co-chaperonin GroES (HSP10)
MNKPSNVKPLGNAALVELVEEEQKVGKVIVPTGTSGLSTGIVVSLPASHDRLPVGVPKDLSVGDRVLFHKDAAQAASLGSNHYLVPLPGIVAVLNEPSAPLVEAGTSFFKVPDWRNFVENEESHKSWKEWENVSQFTFRVRFLEPFRPLAALAQRMYEYGVQEICPHLESFSAMQLELREAKKNELQDQGIFAVRCADDYWDGALVISGDDRLLDFTKTSTDLHALIETSPSWMRALWRTLSDPLFASIAGPEHNRVTLAALAIKQVIRLGGQGVRGTPVKNSQSMGHFLRFGLMPEEEEMSPTLKQLGISSPLAESIGRVDLKLSFDRRIGKKDYTVWFTAEAPLNDKATQIHVTWEVQELYPKEITKQSYGNIMTDFFRDVVLKGFYNTWFDQIQCSTVR